MPPQDEMTIDERRTYVKLMAPRYREAKRSERSALLSEMEQVSKLHRKHVIRLLNAKSVARKKRSTPRSRTYGIEVERVVLRVWESVDYICAERLTPSLGRMARHLAGFGSLVLTPEVESQLATISPSTVERMLRKNRAHKARLPRPGPHRANQVTKGVPMGRIPWNTPDPGHCETDVATGWSERVMLLGRGYQAMERAFHHVLERLPFAVKELHPDTGTEFFNAHLVRFWKERVSGVQLSRSRPYQKNDNRNVEQKNDTLVRHYFGKLRLDTAEQIAVGNALYERMWLYYNLFQPVMHLAEKIVEGDTVRRKWDEAQTPFQRLLATAVLSQEQQERLQTLYEQTNPLLLREEIYTSLTVLWDTALAQNGTAA
jgi:hypothetical protein